MYEVPMRATKSSVGDPTIVDDDDNEVQVRKGKEAPQPTRLQKHQKGLKGGRWPRIRARSPVKMT